MCQAYVKPLCISFNLYKNSILIECYYYSHFIHKERASLIAQLVKNPPAMQETPVRFLGWEDLMEKG